MTGCYFSVDLLSSSVPYEVSVYLQDSKGAKADWKTLKMHMEGASFTAAVT